MHGRYELCSLDINEKSKRCNREDCRKKRTVELYFVSFSSGKISLDMKNELNNGLRLDAEVCTIRSPILFRK